MRKYNFSAGPATLPQSVMEVVQAEMLNWQGQSTSIIEMPHRHTKMTQLLQQTTQQCYDLLDIPDNFNVLFMSGGARMQFSAIPLNFLGSNKKAVYLDSGYWSIAAAKEAQKYGEISLAAKLNRQQKPLKIPAREHWKIDNNATYFHYCDNETIGGIEFQQFPEVDLPLVADMSSNILSKPIDWSKFGLVYAGMQKNIGPAGLALVIVRDDLLDQAQSATPTLIHYKTQAKYHSAFNTLPFFNIYVANKVFAWLQQQGGVLAIQKRNKARAQSVYDFIDASNLYHNDVDVSCRSVMNIPFYIKDAKLEAQFIMQAEKENLINLQGHPSCGGIRVNLYNALPNDAVNALISFMQDFACCNS